MRKQSLEPIFNPSAVAVIGASSKPGSVGGAIFSNLKQAGFAGRIYPINTKHHLIGNEVTLSSLAELPEKPDLVVVCTPAATVPDLLRRCGELRIPGMIVTSAGFREAGSSGKAIEQELRQASQEFPDVRFIGPNCLGLLRPENRLNASFSPIMPSPGRLTFISQSGALCTAILDWATERQIGFANCVSVGNMTNVGMGDLIEYFAHDEQTDVVLLYIEGVTDASHFISAARECSRHKPIIAYKAGRFSESSAAAASHTGAIASSDAMYDAAFRLAGIERVSSIEELFDYSQLCQVRNRMNGNRLGLVTNAGGPAVMASDAWLAVGGKLAKLESDTRAALDRSLPSCWSKANPVDVLGDATADRFQSAIRLTAADPNVDAVLVILTPQTMTRPEAVAQTVIDEASQTNKPIVTSWIGGPAVQSGRSLLKNAGIPTYDFPEEAIHALQHFLSTNRIQTIRETQSTSAAARIFVEQSGLRPTLERREQWRKTLSTMTLVDEVTAKTLFEEYGIPVATSRLARTASEAVALAELTGFPVALKIVSPDISHKSDVGGVVLDVQNGDAVQERFESMLRTIQSVKPDARIEGISIQPMVETHGAFELMLGMTRDPQFGPAIVLSAGGFTAELQHDSVLELAPLDRDIVDRMLRSLRLYPLLKGYRGQPGVDLDELRGVIMKFCQFVDDYPMLHAAEMNPLSVSANRVIALDARMICGTQAPQ